VASGVDSEEQIVRRGIGSYPSDMKGITIKLPDELLAELRREARARGCSVAALIRDKLAQPVQGTSAHALIGDLIGCLKGGSSVSVTNDRPKFRYPGESWASARRRDAAWVAAQRKSGGSTQRNKR
jgi:hypothetical protein